MWNPFSAMWTKKGASAACCFHFESYLPAWDYKRLEMISQDCKCDDVVFGGVQRQCVRGICNLQKPVAGQALMFHRCDSHRTNLN